VSEPGIIHLGIDLARLQALVLDIDGILYEGNQALPGAVELVSHLNQTGFPYVLFSNNSTRRIGEHVDKLKGLGMDVPVERIITAARIAAHVLAHESKPGRRCLVIGEAGLDEALQGAGFEVTKTEWADVAYVVTGMDRELTYEKLLAASRAIRHGAQLISSNPDPVYPTGDEVIPAAGVVQAAIEVSTGVKARVTGKPEIYGFLMALELLKIPAELIGMVGDQPNIDHSGACRAGMKTLLVLSSLTPAYAPSQMEIQPDGVFENTMAFYKSWIRRSSIQLL
jgi:4-nitrophenyl phosphatase